MYQTELMIQKKKRINADLSVWVCTKDDSVNRLFSYFIWTFSTPTPTRVDNKRAENGHSCPPPADPIVSIQRHLRDNVIVNVRVEKSNRPMVSGSDH
ncbi:hypothetical protein T4D_14068 [Trichinella pseudospiralis]|uniref:Uncharacterized protein n=1 Tax=Trichinella pseudospiralis TaxID=6337 RepID=A0A0V1FPP4_TRIPS|nr:hypothetical protein T4D_14068 [Trichinella pseudospiralis]